MRPAQLPQHANGALGLAELHYRGPRRQIEAWVRRLLAAGARLACEGPSEFELALPNASILIVADEGEPALLPSALVMEFDDCAWMRRRCAELGIPHRELEAGAPDLDLTPQLGMHWIFRHAAA